LRTAGFGLSPARTLVLMLLVVAVLFMLTMVGAVMFGFRIGLGTVLMAGCFAAAAGLVLPLMVIAQRAERRRKKMAEQFPVALDIFVRGLRAGHPVASALDLLTQEMSDPIGSEFGIVTMKSLMAPNCATRCRTWPTVAISTICGCSSCRCRSRTRPAAIWRKSWKICPR